MHWFARGGKGPATPIHVWVLINGSCLECSMESSLEPVCILKLQRLILTVCAIDQAGSHDLCICMHCSSHNSVNFRIPWGPSIVLNICRRLQSQGPVDHWLCLLMGRPSAESAIVWPHNHFVKHTQETVKRRSSARLLQDYSGLQG